MKRHPLIILTLAGALALGVAACSNTDVNSVQSLRAAAGIEATAPAPTAQPTPLPTDTPDLQPENIAAPATPQPVVVEVTRIVPATVEVQIEVTRQVTDVQAQYIFITPQPTACNRLTPAPTMTLDANDIAAGVVLKGGWPCGIVGYPTNEVQP